jgi:phosphoadenosine phosphosulfate reductase
LQLKDIQDIIMVNSAQLEADKKLLAPYPRDFKAIPSVTDYGKGSDVAINKELEMDRLSFLAESLIKSLRHAVENKKRPIFTIALIAGDMVILDAIHRAGLLDKIKVIFIDTYTLFPETLAFLRQVEAHYGFKAHVYHAAGIESQAEFEARYGTEYWKEDIDAYDKLCKVEPLQRALAEFSSDCWINGRRRDHGAERASLAVYEGTKLNVLAFWSFEDCWNYLQYYQVPYHPLHDVGYSSLGDKHSMIKVPYEKWMAYGGE